MPTLNDYQAVREARTKDELLGALLAVANQLDFGLLSATLGVKNEQNKTEFFSVANVPPAYAAAFTDGSAFGIDPVQKHVKDNTVPIVWDRDTYLKGNASDLWEIQAPFGYQTGISVALRVSAGRRFVFGVDREQKLPSDAQKLSRLIADVQLLAVHAQDAAVRLLVPERGTSLTKREIEVLHWTMLGKDTAAIAQILELRASTVKFHAENAIAKLGCESRYAAVIRAIALGLLEPR